VSGRSEAPYRRPPSWDSDATGRGVAVGARGAGPASPPSANGNGRTSPAKKRNEDRLAEVARGSTLNLVGAMISAAATLGVTVFVTRHFSRPVAGAFFTAISVFLIAEAIGSLGVKTGIVYFIARLRSLGEERRIPRIIRAAIIPVLLASLVVMTTMFVLADPLAHVLLSGRLGQGKVSPASVAQALRALALAIPFATLLDAFLGGTRGYRNMRCTVAVDSVGRSVGQFVAVLVASIASSAALLAPLWALPYVPAAAVAGLWFRRLRRSRKPMRAAAAAIPPALAALMALGTPVSPVSVRASRHHGGTRATGRRIDNGNPRGFWRFTIPRGFAQLAQVTLQRVDIVLVAIMRGPVDAAIYTAATRFLVVGQWGSLAVNQAAQPRFTEFFSVNDLRAANMIYQATTAWLVLMTWPLYLLAVVYGPELLALFGRSYSAGDAVIVILGLSALLAQACGQVDMVLITSGRTSWSLANIVLTLGVNIGIDILLIPKYGIAGAAIGWAVAIAVNNLVPLVQIATVLGLHPMGRGTVVACALTALSFGIVPLAARSVLGHGAGPALAGIALGCAVMTAGLWRFRGALRLSAIPAASVLRRFRWLVPAR
jgi:O-antigen/teichoic acid export membrane protein